MSVANTIFLQGNSRNCLNCNSLPNPFNATAYLPTVQNASASNIDSHTITSVNNGARFVAPLPLAEYAVPYLFNSYSPYKGFSTPLG